MLVSRLTPNQTHSEVFVIDVTFSNRLINDDIFEACHTVVPPKQYYENCLYDACGCDLGGDCKLLDILELNKIHTKEANQ